jgi:hypothetical protein
MILLGLGGVFLGGSALLVIESAAFSNQIEFEKCYGYCPIGQYMCG